MTVCNRRSHHFALLVKCQFAQLVGLGVLCGLRGYLLFFRSTQFRAQLVRDRRRDLRLQGDDVTHGIAALANGLQKYWFRLLRLHEAANFHN
jgi:hypothetical protein